MLVNEKALEEVRRSLVVDKFHIVYPASDRTRLSVVGFSNSTYYELDQYDVASRRRFNTEPEANEYARQLAREHGLTFTSDPQYLD